MEYKTVSDIFYFMQELEKQSVAFNDIRLELKSKGKNQEAEAVLKIQGSLTSTILKYHSLICEYVESENALIDDFDFEIKDFLEYHNYYNYAEWNEYKYSNEAIEEEKREVFKDFINELYSIVIDNDFYSEDKAIQAFINNFSKIDLYLYILSK